MMAYCRMLVREGVINTHVFEEPPYMGIEEALNLHIIELRVNENRPDVGLYNIRKTLQMINKDK